MSNFKRAVVTGGNVKSDVLSSLRSTKMVETKPVLPAGQYNVDAGFGRLY
jgi:hypothetical protein